MESTDKRYKELLESGQLSKETVDRVKTDSARQKTMEELLGPQDPPGSNLGPVGKVMLTFILAVLLSVLLAILLTPTIWLSHWIGSMYP